MGEGYAYECECCDNYYSIYYGSGMLFPDVYEEITKNITDGIYGDKWKVLYESIEDPVVACDLELYICPKCSNWSNDYNLSLYNFVRPKDNKVRRPVFGKGYTQTVPEHKYMLFPKLDCKFVKPYIHMCSKCSSRMHKVKWTTAPKLACPRCGKSNDSCGLLMWD